MGPLTLHSPEYFSSTTSLLLTKITSQKLLWTFDREKFLVFLEINPPEAGGIPVSVEPKEFKYGVSNNVVISVICFLGIRSAIAPIALIPLILIFFPLRNLINSSNIPGIKTNHDNLYF